MRKFSIYKILTAGVILALLAIFSFNKVNAQNTSCSFSSDSTISSSDSSCDGKDVVVNSGATLTISGQHNFNNLTIKANAKLTHPNLATNDYDGSTWVLNGGVNKTVSIKVSLVTTIEQGGQINVTGKGYKGATSVGPVGCAGNGSSRDVSCNRGDGPGGGVAAGEGSRSGGENWISGAGASFGGFGGFGGWIDSTGEVASAAYPRQDTYDYQGVFNNSSGLYHGSGGAASRNLKYSSTNVSGGAGGGVVHLVTGSLKGNGEIVADGDLGQSAGSWVQAPGSTGNSGWTYHGYAGSSGSGGLVFINITANKNDSSGICPDVSGGSGPSQGGGGSIISRSGKAGTKSVAVNETSDCSGSNVIKINARGGNGVTSSEFGKNYPGSAGGGGIVGTGGGGGRVYLINEARDPAPKSYSLNASLVATPSSGTAPLNNVSLSASETTNNPVFQNYFEWQFSCDDGSANTTINGVLLNSRIGLSPYTPDDKCNYPTPGSYFAKVVISKPADAIGYYVPSFYRTRIDANAPKPTVTFSASPTSINLGSSSTLSWTSSNATSLSIDNGVGTVSVPNGTKVVSPTKTVIYTITATGLGGTATATATVTVILPKPTVTFSASPTSINLGSSSTLSWTSSNATSLSIDNGIGPVVIPNGTKTVSPTTTTTYTITASNAVGSATATATVTVVNEPTEVQNVIIEKRMYRYNKDTGRVETSTFEPGDNVIVTIRINTNGQTDLKASLLDLRSSETELPVNITSGADKANKCALSSSDNILTGDFSANDGSDNSSWNNLSLPTSDNYICYSYYIKANADAKNIVSHANAVLRDTTSDLILGESNNVMMVKGFPFINSEATPQVLDTSKAFMPIEDLLSFSSTILTDDTQDNSAKSSATSVSYVYKRGIGPKSRGGVFLALPVKMTDKAGADLAYGQSFMLYNPAFYLFGNVFSGENSVGSSLDLGSRSNAITRNAFDPSNKLNSDASLYGYDFDKDSVIVWDRSNNKENLDKNQKMTDSIESLIKTPTPPIVCPEGKLKKADLSSGNLFLDNPGCDPKADSSDQIWPNGRVWYLKATSDIEINATIQKKGTIIIDFSGSNGNPTVRISTKSGSFQGLSQLGLIVINGGNVQFTNSAQAYNGIIFAPGKINEQTTCTSGNINFEQGGNPIKIKGSIVASCINFQSRSRDNGAKYAVTIYSDAKLLNSVLPGFENIMTVILGK